MAENSSEVQELSTLYLDILHKLNAVSTPDWLHLDLTFQQMKVLYILKQNGPLKMSELHKKLGVSMPTITGIVNRLIERRDGKALLARETSPEDRREVWARLTDAGVEVTEMVGELNPNALEAAFNNLTEEEVEGAKLALVRLNQVVDQHVLDLVSGNGKVPEAGTTVEAGAKRTRRATRQPVTTTRETDEVLALSGSSSAVNRRFDTYSTRPILT